jgi:hypothetical protein
MATWVPEEKQDLKWKIWNQKFLAQVPNIQTRSKDHIKLFGSPTCGDSFKDRQTANELLDTYLSIAQMVIYHHEGVSVRLLKIRDAKTIYEMVCEYLSQWKRFLETTLVHNPIAPYDDLIAMNAFVQVIYPHAVDQLSTANVESWLSKRITTLGSRTLTLRGDPPPTGVVYQDDSQGPVQPRATVAEKMFSNRKRW